ncbi:MAG: hypothetical protein DRN95_07735, partial [Candidatus Hydrothermarchaeota archaeon]
AAKWLHSDEIFYFETRNEDDSDITADILKLVDEADIVIGHNAQKFDMKKINAYAILNGLEPPSPYRVIDTMLIAKRYFAFEQNTLDYLSHALCTTAKSAHKKFTGFELWKACMQGDEDAWAEMKHYNCLIPTHKVLTQDLRWQQIGDLVAGDVLLGFDEEAGDYGRSYKESTVISVRRAMDTVYNVRLSNGDAINCTGDHKWLASTYTSSSVDSRSSGTNTVEWKTTKELLVNSKTVEGNEPKGTKGKDLSTAVYKNFEVVDELLTKDIGWLAGMFDGEGSLYNRKDAKGFSISISQKIGPELDKICRILDNIKVSYHVSTRTPEDTAANYPEAFKHNLDIGVVTLTGGYVALLRFLQLVRPERLITKLDLSNAPRMENNKVKVLVTSVEEVGTKEIVILETTSATYIADGYSMHNCQDVRVTEELYLILRPWAKNHPSIVTTSESTVKRCTACGSKNIHEDGYTITNVSKFRRYKCEDCGSFSKARTNLLSPDARKALLTSVPNG